MATPSPAPYSITKSITPVIVDGVEHLQGYGSYPAINYDTNLSWQLIHPIMVGTSLVNQDGRYGFGKPTRIELFMGSDTFRTRGLALFDKTGRLIVHVVNALLGYGGSGPHLSWQIMEFLGVSKEIFDKIQAATSQENGTMPYRVILLRESSSKWVWHKIE